MTHAAMGAMANFLISCFELANSVIQVYLPSIENVVLSLKIYLVWHRA